MTSNIYVTVDKTSERQLELVSLLMQNNRITTTHNESIIISGSLLDASKAVVSGSELRLINSYFTTKWSPSALDNPYTGYPNQLNHGNTRLESLTQLNRGLYKTKAAKRQTNFPYIVQIVSRRYPSPSNQWHNLAYYVPTRIWKTQMCVPDLRRSLFPSYLVEWELQPFPTTIRAPLCLTNYTNSEVLKKLTSGCVPAP